MPCLRIAVLECDTPIDPVRARHGTYGDIFELLLTTSLKTLGESQNTELQFSKWDVVNHQVYPKPEEFDAILLTGSKHDAFADHPWIISLTNYVHEVYQQNKPIVGICFGHQIVGRALGARVGRGDGGWEVAVEDMSLTDEGRKLFSKDTLSLQQMHRDIVYEIPDGCVNLGSSPRCALQGFYQPGRILTVQGHPEFTGYIMTKIVEMRHELKVFDDELFQSAISRAGIAHDGELVAQAICKFLV